MVSVERIKNSRADLSHSKVGALDCDSRSNEIEVVRPLIQAIMP